MTGEDGYDTRYVGGNEYVPPVERRTAPAPRQPLARPAPATSVAATEAHTEVVLTREYQAYEIAVRRITLRQPVGRDIAKCGNPLKVMTGADGRVTDIEVKWDVVAKYIPLLASPPMPASTVDSFVFDDLDACAAVIVGFFVKFRQSET